MARVRRECCNGIIMKPYSNNLDLRCANRSIEARMLSISYTALLWRPMRRQKGLRGRRLFLGLQRAAATSMKSSIGLKTHYQLLGLVSKNTSSTGYARIAVSLDYHIPASTRKSTKLLYSSYCTVAPTSASIDLLCVRRHVLVASKTAAGFK